jgi:hypothetical protein
MISRSLYKRLERVEARIVADLQAVSAAAAARSAPDRVAETMRKFAIVVLPGESRACALARAMGMSNRELLDFLRRHSNSIG